MKNRIVFFGTPHFSAEILCYLLSHHVPIVGLVTQPDRPKGRSLQVTPSPVKDVASGETPLLQPAKASDKDFLQALRMLQGDLYVVVAYGQILPPSLLAIPRLGVINVHTSLLPKYRGAAPIQRCLMAGETQTGVSIQKIVPELDAGDVIATRTCPISPDMTFGELEKELCILAKPLLLEVLQAYETKIPLATAQDPNQVSYAKKIELAEGEIHWDEPAALLHNRIRAFSPRPGAWCWLEPGHRRLKILRTRIAKQTGSPGKLLEPRNIVACGNGALELIEVQPEGKKAMAADDWLRGVPGLKQFLQ